MRKDRRDFFKSVDAEELVDCFPLFIDRQDLIRYLVRYELFKKILKVEGCIIEAGVHKGASALLFAKLSSIFEPYAFSREIIGFDTFTGIPNLNKKDGDFISLGQFSDVNFKTIEKSIEFYDRNRPIGHLPKVLFVKGDAVQTIPKYFSENPSLVVAMLYLDFDIYEPTLAALKTILPRMPKGAIVVFDQFNERRVAGETLALLEILEINKIEIKSFPQEPHISYFIL